MSNRAGKLFLKITQMLFNKNWTILNYIILSTAWSIGKGCIFHGRVYVPSVGGDVQIGNSVRFGACVNICAARSARLLIGNNVSVNQGTHIVARELVVIGDNVLIGEYSSIRDNDHGWSKSHMLVREQGFVTKSVSIGDDVWIGRNVTILKGVSIGQGAVIAAGAVVTKSVEEYTVVAGVPAKVIGRR